MKYMKINVRIFLPSLFCLH